MQLSREAFESAHAQQTQLANIAMLSDIRHEVVGPLVEMAVQSAEQSCELASDRVACVQEVKAAIFAGIYNLPLSFTHEETRTLLTCAPKGQRINVNQLKLDQNATEAEQNAPAHFRRTRFERYLQEEHGLYATWQLLELLDFVFDRSGEVNAYLANDERLFVADSRFYRGAILDERHFFQVVRDYALLSHDEQALEIPWERFLSFSDATTRLDFDHLQPEACAIAFWDDPRICEAEEPLFGSREEMMALSQESNLSVHHFNVHTGYNPMMACRVLWQSGPLSHTYHFAFDIDRQQLLEFSIAP